jgi:hypothetical protein
MAYEKDIIDRRRIRTITGSFSWIDHRVITGGFLDGLSTIALALYFFLMAVSDRHGVSFYRDDRICGILKVGLDSLGEARSDLIARSLIAYRYPLYQVLALPEKPVTAASAKKLAQEKKRMDVHYLQKLKAVICSRQRSR